MTVPAPDAHALPQDIKTPLYVDLDGTLLATDTLWESILALTRSRPWMLARLPGWVLAGKAAFKRKLADLVIPDINTLPLRPEVLEFLQTEKAKGRPIILATAADARIARALADHLGLFDDVLASDGTTNLSGDRKLSAIREHCKGVAFDYLGDSHVDLPIWKASRNAIVCGGHRSVLACVQSQGNMRELATTTGSQLVGMLRALRPHQWSKNLLVMVPLIVSHQFVIATQLLATLIAIAAFCAIASSVYILNDLLDLPNDRQHPRKRRRPFAAGQVPIPTGIALGMGVWLVGLLGGTALLGWDFGAMLLLYWLCTTAYSTYLKKKLILDVLVLAGLYTLRILAGAVAIEVVPSPWLLAFSMFLFISLAFAKRYAELRTYREQDLTEAPGRRYNVSDMDLFKSVGPTSAYLAVLVLALYIQSDDVLLLYSHPTMLWLLCPVLLYWITRLWFLVDRSELLDDPVIFALRDKASYISLAVALIIVAIAK